MNDQTLIQTAQKAGLVAMYETTNVDRGPYWQLEFADDSDFDARLDILLHSAEWIATRLIDLKCVEQADHPKAAEWRERQDRLRSALDIPMDITDHCRLRQELATHVGCTEHLQSYSVKEGANA